MVKQCNRQTMLVVQVKLHVIGVVFGFDEVCRMFLGNHRGHNTLSSITQELVGEFCESSTHFFYMVEPAGYFLSNRRNPSCKCCNCLYKQLRCSRYISECLEIVFPRITDKFASIVGQFINIFVLFRDKAVHIPKPVNYQI